MSPDGLELRILGPLELVRQGRPSAVDGRKPRQLLATLALHHGRTVSVDQVIGVLWPGDPPRSAVANVHTYVSYLRTRLGDERITRRPPGYRLDLGPAELDAARFEAWGAELSTVDAALGLWRGWPVEDLPHCALWEPEVDRLTATWRTLRERRAGLLIEAGSPAAAITDLHALVAEEPLREESWLLLITALEATGRKAEALAAYAQLRRTLSAELGIEPGEPLRRAHQRLLLREAGFTTGERLDASAAAVLRGLSTVRLGPVPGWVASALLGRDATGVLGALEEARLIRATGADGAGQQRYALPTLVGLLAPDLPGQPDPGALGRVLGGYLHLAEQAAAGLPSQLFGPGVRVAARWPAGGSTADPLAWFEAERDALLAGVRIAPTATLAWELAHALVPWCDLTGHSTDWEAACRSALDTCRREGDLLGEAVMLRGLGQLHLYQDHYEQASEAFSRARLLYARLGNRCGEASALAGLGTVHRVLGEPGEAEACFQRALTAYTLDVNLPGMAYAHGALGLVALGAGRPAAARRWIGHGLALARQAGDPHRIAHLTHQAGVVALRTSEPARDLLTEALGMFAQLGDAHGEAYCLVELATFDTGGAAVTRLGRALEIFERIGDRAAQAATAARLGELHRGSLGEAYTAEAHRLQTQLRPL
ncbi:BTAD domain-containing putative transcriptional regulator [Longispora albida]|uniref:BTAD domain-containing putative transcriptional regulator n=1 Tax=Longispora albida TaxID=203523 RepID=UPI0003610419|nr:BTAD domain-containing putative transcriptional regulator [Longispora albida]